MGGFSSTFGSVCDLFIRLKNWYRFGFIKNVLAYFGGNYTFHWLKDKFLTRLVCGKNILWHCFAWILFFRRFYLFTFREMRTEGKWEGEKHLCAREISIDCLLHTLNWGPGPQPKHVPWWELNQWPFGAQAGTQSTEPHHPGMFCQNSYWHILGS